MSYGAETFLYNFLLIKFNVKNFDFNLKLTNALVFFYFNIEFYKNFFHQKR